MESSLYTDARISGVFDGSLLPHAEGNLHMRVRCGGGVGRACRAGEAGG